MHDIKNIKLEKIFVKRRVWLGTGTSDTLLRTEIMFRSMNERKYLKNLRSYKRKKGL